MTRQPELAYLEYYGHTKCVVFIANAEEFNGTRFSEGEQREGTEH